MAVLFNIKGSFKRHYAQIDMHYKLGIMSFLFPIYTAGLSSSLWVVGCVTYLYFFPLANHTISFFSAVE